MALTSSDITLLKFISRGRTTHQKIRKELGIFSSESVTAVNRLQRMGYVKKVMEKGWKIEVTEDGLREVEA